MINHTAWGGHQKNVHTLIRKLLRLLFVIFREIVIYFVWLVIIFPV
jgi:hypothetical protein